MNHKLPKIDFPQFNGESPREWVRKANKYFQLHQVPDELKVGIAEMYLKGKADVWFHGFQSSHPNADWEILATEVCRRFAETTSEEVVETFCKIRQYGGIAEYVEKFEGLKAQAMSLTVTVANGQKLDSKSVNLPITWQMQGIEFQFKLRSLQLGGSDMVLGVNWLSQFGPVTFDFKEGHINFMSDGGKVTLCSGNVDGRIELINGPQLESSLVQQPYGLVGTT
ncbi:Uncharacterized protein Adt_05431 [Abeliophyllum distichum]|uniref:Retrotransposon gag domain-containing protein n=1 Tax=Abeliophyllum distichum TaxID=126358 RepID=A0ABD1V429_9LAMI